MAEVGLGATPMTLREKTYNDNAMRKMGLGERIPARGGTITPAPVTLEEQTQQEPSGAAGNAGAALIRGRDQIAGGLTGLGNKFGGLAEPVFDAAADLIGPSDTSLEALRLREEERDQRVAAGDLSYVSGEIADVADIAAGEALPMAADVTGGYIAGKVGEKLADVGKMKAKGLPAKALVWGARLFGAGLLEYGQARDSSIRAAGYDPDSDDVPDEVKNRADYSALGQTLMNEVVPLRALERIAPAKALETLKGTVGGSGKLKRVAGSFVGDSVTEVATEVGQDAIEQLIMIPGALDQLTQAEMDDIAPYVKERYGSWEQLKGLAAAAVAGGGTGSASSVVEELKAAGRKQDATKMAAQLEPLGMTPDKAASIVASTGGTQKIQEAVPAIGRAMTQYNLGMAEIDEAITKGMDPEDATQAKAELTAMRDATTDKYAEALGLPMRQSDVDRQNDLIEKEKETAAMGRLRKFGVTRPEALPDTLTETADRLEALSEQTASLDARVRATADPERKAETQRELDQTKIDYRTAQIEAKMNLEGKSRVLAESEVAMRDQTEKQKAKREEAIGKQLENEFPAIMSDDEKRAKAEELVASYEDNPSDDDKSLRKKIRRLEGQRRKATDPETIDNLNEDIAELEARQGLTTPAVEAAQRVLQDLGPRATTAEDGASRPDPQPTLAAAKDTVESDGVVPKQDAEPDAAAATPKKVDDEAVSEDTPLLKETAARDEVRSGVRKARGKKSVDLVPNTSEPERLSLLKQANLIRTAKKPSIAKETALGRAVVDAGYKSRLTKPKGDDAIDYAAVGREAAIALTYAANEEAGLGNEALLTEGDVAAEDDPRRSGYDDVYEWDDLLDVVGQEATLETAEAKLAEWTKNSGKEASAHFAADGTLLGVGTSNLKNGVMPPRQGWGDPTVTFTHTHPIFTPFSNADVRGMMAHGGPYRAVLPDGSVTAMRPLKPMTRARAKLTAMQKVIIDASDAVMPADTSISSKASVRQEVLLQYLESEGFIEYTEPFTNMTQEDQDHVATILEDADAELRRQQNVRARTAGTGADGGRDGGTTAAGPEKLTTPGARAKRDARTVADRDRIRELGDRIYDYYSGPIPGERRPRNLKKAIKSGVTRGQVREATKVAVSGIGNKSNYVLRDVAYSMFPELRTDPDAVFEVPSATSSRYKDAQGKMQLKPNAENDWKFSTALQLVGAVAETSGDTAFFYHDPRWVKQLKTNRKFKAYHMDVNSVLKKQLGYTGSPQSSLLPPMENPDDTSQIVKNKDMHMTEDQQVPGRRTAQYFQRNSYTIDQNVLAKLQPEDLISGKGVAAKGITLKEDLPEWRRISADLSNGVELSDLPEADQIWYKSKGFVISDQMRTASRKLERFRESVAEHEKLYPGEPVGFQYQIDNKGRIYADGDLNPQTSDEVKKMFMVDGVSLGDMTTVDNSASGWQVAALIAKDEVLAPQINLGKGQATIPGFQKQDMYLATIDNLKRRVTEDANRTGKMTKQQREDKKVAQIALKDIVEPGKLQRNLIKTPVIAVNYAATTKNFSDHFTKAFAPLYPNGKLPPKLASYLGKTARAGLSDAAPHTMAMQDWAVKTIADVTRAVEKNGVDSKPQNSWTVGSNGTYKRLKFDKREAQIRFRATPFRIYKTKEEAGQVLMERDEKGDPILEKIDTKDGGHISEIVPIETGEIDANATARSVYSQIIQGFDASILHETVETYKQATDGGFVTTNHDAFTAPKDFSPMVAEAARRSMHKVMKDAGDIPMRIYNDAVRNLEAAGKTQAEIDALITKPPAPGSYNIDDVLTSTPVFAEDANGNDYVPEYGTLPDDPVAVEPEERSEPELANAIDVAQYMEQREDRSYFAEVQNWAGGGTGAILAKMVRSIDAGLTNALVPIKQLEVRERGELGVGMDSAFKSAEMAINDSGRNESILYYGAGKRGQYGEYQTAPGTVGLRTILKTASGGKVNGQQLAHWEEWMAARRAKELNAKGIKTPQTAADIATALGRERPEFREAADMWNAHNKANLQLAKDTGLITQAQMDAMAADAFYIPFYRADQRIDGTSPVFDMPKIGSSGSHVTARDPGIKKMKGGDKMRIANISMNMLKNSQALTAAAMRNQAANQTFDLLMDAGLAKEVKASKKPHKNAVTMIRDGKESYLVPLSDDALPVMAAMAAMDPVNLNLIGRAANAASAMKRQSVTIMPSFLITNAWRGMTQNAIMSGGANIGLKNNPVTGFAKSMKESWTEAGDASARDFKRLSGMGDYRRGQLPTDFGSNDLLREMGLDTRGAGYWYRKGMDSYETIGMGTELMDRVAVYDNMIAAGSRPDEAAYQALNLMNYSRKGGWPGVRVALSMMPFMNARIQGYRRIFEGATVSKGLTQAGRKAAVGIALNGLVYSAVNVAIMMWNLGDEERAEKYKALSTLRRTLGLNLVLPPEMQFMGIEVLTIPHPFDIGFIFGAIPSAAVEQFYEAQGWTRDEAGNPVQDVSNAVAEQMFVTNLIPQFAVPFMEWNSGIDNFTKRPMVSRSQTDLAPDLQDKGAGEFAKWLGQDVGLSFVDIPILGQQSPVLIDNWIDELGGTAGMLADTAFGMIMQGKGGVPTKPGGLIGNGQLGQNADRALRNFFVDPDLSRTRYGDDFYDAGNEIVSRIATAKEVVERGGSGADAVERLGSAEYQRLDTARKAFNQAKQRLSQLATMDAVVKDGTHTPAKKRQLLARHNTERKLIVKNMSRAMKAALGDS